MKQIAVISLTERGRALSARIQDAAKMSQIRRFCFIRHTDENAEAFHDLAALIAKLFCKYDALLFVCACGIAVRMIAPLLRSKQSDPAVLVIDERGRYVIPVLSGHLGGANALAEKIAGCIGAKAIITTATDIGGQFSPDSFAAANHLLVTDWNAAKQIATAVLDGKPIGFHCAAPFRNLPPELSQTDHAEYGIVVGDAAEEAPYPVTLRLIPKNIVLGIGCRRGISAQQITDTVNAVFAENAVSTARICKAASIDRKADEVGLLRFCADLGIPLQTYSADDLMTVSGTFAHSDFAQEVTGADNICERSSVLCSGGTLIIPKKARNGVTVAAAEIPIEIDFEKRML